MQVHFLTKKGRGDPCPAAVKDARPPPQDGSRSVSWGKLQISLYFPLEKKKITVEIICNYSSSPLTA